MMTRNVADAPVIDLATHPVWRSARRRSREFAEAKRRHPSSYRADADTYEPSPSTGGRVLAFTCVRPSRPGVTSADED